GKLKYILNSPHQTTDKFSVRLIIKIYEYNNKSKKRKKCSIFNLLKINIIVGSFLPKLPFG
ncbi:MAG: hypothetical protein PVI94_26990, partial [Desulfobacterales bacterium]